MWDPEDVVVAVEDAGVCPRSKELGPLESLGFVALPSFVPNTVRVLQGVDRSPPSDH